MADCDVELPSLLSWASAEHMFAQRSASPAQCLLRLVTSNRITAVTRSSYSNKQAKIIEWFTENYAEHVDTTSQPVVLRLEAIPPTIIGALLASFVVKNKVDKDGSTTPYSSSHMNGYCSALVSLYKDNKVPLPPAVDTVIKS